MKSNDECYKNNEQKNEEDIISEKVENSIMLEHENDKMMYNLFGDNDFKRYNSVMSVIENKQEVYKKLKDLTKKCKDDNDNNTLVSFTNDNELISLIKASVGDRSCTLQYTSHDEKNLSNKKNNDKDEYVGDSYYAYKQVKIDPRLNQKIVVKLQINCGSYFSNYIAHARKGQYLRKVNDIKEFVKKKSYICM